MMQASETEYLSLVTSEHQGLPRFEAMLRLFSSPLVSGQNQLLSMQQLFDLDDAEGDQLDTLGKWIGLSRHLPVPVAGVYFEWDSITLGWDQGQWFGRFDAASGLTTLDDETYRLFLRAKVGANHWDGSCSGWMAVMNYVFTGTGTTVSYADYQDMSMDVLITGETPPVLALHLIKDGYLLLKPAGVRIRHYYTPSVPGAPLFAWDAASGSGFGGWDSGAWATSL